MATRPCYNTSLG
uniref:Uncharacterized protein n=1 Tax=Arundo donax TaxID=35708 RepID=A0A0A9HLJ7_ARUDO